MDDIHYFFTHDQLTNFSFFSRRLINEFFNILHRPIDRMQGFSHDRSTNFRTEKMRPKVPPGTKSNIKEPHGAKNSKKNCQNDLQSALYTSAPKKYHR